MFVLFFLYDLIFIIGLIVYLPFYFYHKKINFPALSEKLGFLSSREDKNEKSIWIQVVSVGEVNLIVSLVKKLKELLDYDIIITTTTLTGNKLAKKNFGSLAKVYFFPWDISCIVKKVIKIINPKIFIAVETEIWPNLFYQLKKKNIPVVLINGRISHTAFNRYKFIKPIIGSTLNRCSYIGVQNSFYKDRFCDLGCKGDKVVISGNMKFEGILVDEERLLEIKRKYSVFLKKEGYLLLISASTHYPEERVILDIYKSILDSRRDIILLIAPRHIERLPLIEKDIACCGLKPLRLGGVIEHNHDADSVYLLDTIGELMYLYSLCDICFVGGSLAEHGGQNILEPIYFLKPTCFGPYMDNFRDVEEIVLSRKAGIRVKDAHELKNVFMKLIEDHNLRKDLSGRCLDVFREGKKDLEKNLEIILKCL